MPIGNLFKSAEKPFAVEFHALFAPSLFAAFIGGLAPCFDDGRVVLLAVSAIGTIAPLASALVRMVPSIGLMHFFAA